MSGKHSRHNLFHDFVTMASSTLIVRSSPSHAEQSEAEYMAVAGKYTSDELTQFAHLLAITTLALDDKPQDFLGAVFMQAEISNSHMGQFFTPYELSLMTAQMTLQGVDTSKELITVQEPACGSGGMVVAFCEAARAIGINYQSQTYTVATDLSEVAARMAYIQLSLLGIPAHVVWGDTLRMKFFREWPTFAFWGDAHKVARWRKGGDACSTSEPCLHSKHPDHEPASITPSQTFIQPELFQL